MVSKLAVAKKALQYLDVIGAGVRWVGAAVNWFCFVCGREVVLVLDRSASEIIEGFG